MKIMNLNDKIKELEEQMIKKDNELEVVKQELEEEKEISQKAVETISEKEDEIEQLKKKKCYSKEKKYNRCIWR
jgi:lipid II:glycine glycyltransferase (peptidoglycan interpeptide bridge formation enzyme)